MPRKPHHTPSESTLAVLEPDTASANDDAHTRYIDLRNGNGTAPERKALIYSCADSLNMSPQEIARKLEMDSRTVKAILQARETQAVDARNLLAAHTFQLTEDWLLASKMGALKGKHSPAKDALLHLKVIEPIQEQPTVQVAIIVGAPGQPLALQPPQVTPTKADTD